MKKTSKTIGEMTKLRGTWERKPITQVVPNKKGYTRKQKHRKDWSE